MIALPKPHSGERRVWLAVYPLLWPVLTLLVFLYNDRTTPTFHSEVIPYFLAVAYLLGTVPAIMIGWLVDALGLHTAQVPPKILVGSSLALGIAGALSLTVLFVILFIGPATVVCCLLVRVLNRTFGRSS